MFYVCTSMVMALVVGLLHDPRGSLSSRCWQRAAYTRLYSWGKPVIPNLSADMPVPFLISIEGNIGAGKSTLSMAITRIVEIEQGSIIIDGVNISELSIEMLR